MSASLTVVITDHAWSIDIEREIASTIGATCVVPRSLDDDDELIELCRTADALQTNWRKVPEAALLAATNCRVVTRYGVGVDNIPVALATELGIVVTNVPDFCFHEVTDHTVALLLALSRRLFPFAKATRNGEWGVAPVGPGMTRLSGQTLGLVGYGQLAKEVARKALVLGLEICCYTPRLSPGPIADGIVATNRLDELVARSDFVSLHTPATPETIGMINESILRQMKPTAYLINTARGALVDEDALYRALTEGWIAGAALDVVNNEPPPATLALRFLDNVIMTPHVAFYSDQAIIDVQTRATQQTVQALQGVIPEHVVNPEVLRSPQFRGGALTL